MRKMTTRKAIAASALALTALLGTVETSAHPRRYRLSHTIRVGYRIVVSRPVAVRTVVINGRSHGVIDFNVQPEETRIWIDGEYRGVVDAFDGFPDKMTLLPGRHEVVLEAPDGSRWSEIVRVVAGTEIDIRLELEG